MEKRNGTADSILACYSEALKQKYKIFGLQNGGACWLSNNLTQSKIYGQCGACTNCQNPSCNCAAKKCSNGDDCGDVWASALYSIVPVVPSIQPVNTGANDENTISGSVVTHDPSDQLSVVTYVGIAFGVFMSIGLIILAYIYFRKYQNSIKVISLNDGTHGHS